MLSVEQLQTFDKLLIVDLEATCSADSALPPSKMETIEIGAVLVDPDHFEIRDEFQAFIKPVRKPTLTEFCVNLTGITQEMVSEPASYFEVFPVFVEWINTNAVGSVFCSWGAYDRRQLEQDCAMHGLAYDLPLHANLKALFSDRQSTKRPVGMAVALELCDIELSGQHHRALDDAKNIAQLLPWIVGNRTIKGRSG